MSVLSMGIIYCKMQYIINPWVSTLFLFFSPFLDQFDFLLIYLVIVAPVKKIPFFLVIAFYAINNNIWLNEMKMISLTHG